MDGTPSASGDRPFPVDRFTENIKEPSQHTIPDRNRETPFGIDDAIATGEALRRGQRHAAYRIAI